MFHNYSRLAEQPPSPAARRVLASQPSRSLVQNLAPIPLLLGLSILVHGNHDDERQARNTPRLRSYGYRVAPARPVYAFMAPDSVGSRPRPGRAGADAAARLRGVDTREDQRAAWADLDDAHLL